MAQQTTKAGIAPSKTKGAFCMNCGGPMDLSSQYHPRYSCRECPTNGLLVKNRGMIVGTSGTVGLAVDPDTLTPDGQITFATDVVDRYREIDEDDKDVTLLKHLHEWSDVES